MAISFKCLACGKRLKAPDGKAGKKTSCPACGDPVTVPVPIQEPEQEAFKWLVQGEELPFPMDSPINTPSDDAENEAPDFNEPELTSAPISFRSLPPQKIEINDFGDAGSPVSPGNKKKIGRWFLFTVVGLIVTSSIGLGLYFGLKLKEKDSADANLKTEGKEKKDIPIQASTKEVKKAAEMPIPEKKNLDAELIKQQLEDAKKEIAKLKEQIIINQKPPDEIPVQPVPKPQTKLPYKEAFNAAAYQFLEDAEAYCKILEKTNDTKDLDKLDNAALKVFRSFSKIPGSSFENPEINYPEHRAFRVFGSKIEQYISSFKNLLKKDGERGLIGGKDRYVAYIRGTIIMAKSSSNLPKQP